MLESSLVEKDGALACDLSSSRRDRKQIEGNQTDTGMGSKSWCLPVW